MKYSTTFSNLLFFLCLFFLQTSSAQVYVRIGSPRRTVVVERPPCPGRDYVWIEGHYVYDNYTGRDVWIPGQWEYVAPRRHDRRYEREEHHRGRGREYAPGQHNRADGRY